MSVLAIRQRRVLLESLLTTILVRRQFAHITALPLLHVVIVSPKPVLFLPLGPLE